MQFHALVDFLARVGEDIESKKHLKSVFGAHLTESEETVPADQRSNRDACLFRIAGSHVRLRPIPTRGVER